MNYDYIFFGPLRRPLVLLVDYLPEILADWLYEKLYPSDATIILKDYGYARARFYLKDRGEGN
jgi:hypothetical protein